MQIRVVQLNSRNPLVGALLLVVVLALIAFLLTAGMAIVAGGAVLGGVGYALRRVFGAGKASASIGSFNDADLLRADRSVRPLGEEVFPPAPRPESHRLGDGGDA